MCSVTVAEFQYTAQTTNAFVDVAYGMCNSEINWEDFILLNSTFLSNRLVMIAESSKECNINQGLAGRWRLYDDEQDTYEVPPVEV